MSCGCEHKKLASEYERMRRLAKATARLQENTVVLYRNDDGTFGISPDLEIKKNVVEFITPY
jgi:hypothetical protein|nr:MAG TPA: hypothetical protein [Caudoviricetes sp.]DAZ02870.1 MAG TPA: hypothetical protein [Caudoviricetes sp.]